MKKSTKNTESYTWGNKCKGWHFVQSSSLSIIEEFMPPHTEEQNHYHTKAQQFFYILKGTATFIIENQTIEVTEREGIHIKPNTYHQIKNQTNEHLEFLVISEPTSRGDRVIQQKKI